VDRLNITNLAWFGGNAKIPSLLAKSGPAHGKTWFDRVKAGGKLAEAELTVSADSKAIPHSIGGFTHFAPSVLLVRGTCD
jgi:hypothetical protein